MAAWAHCPRGPKRLTFRGDEGCRLRAVRATRGAADRGGRQAGAANRRGPGQGACRRGRAGMPCEDAASFGGGGLSALGARREPRGEKAEGALVRGAPGARGPAGVQRARHFGAEVTAVCGAKNLELVKSLGATMAID